MHWPGVAKVDAKSPINAQLRKETWRVLEEYHGQGKFKAIGVSNYTVAHLQELLGYAEVRAPQTQAPFPEFFLLVSASPLKCYHSLSVDIPVTVCVAVVNLLNVL